MWPFNKKTIKNDTPSKRVLDELFLLDFIKPIELSHLECFVDNNITRAALEVKLGTPQTQLQHGGILDMLGPVNKRFYQKYERIVLFDSEYSLCEIRQEKRDGVCVLCFVATLGHTPLICLINKDGLVQEDTQFSQSELLMKPSCDNLYQSIVYEILIWKYMEEYRNKISISINDFLQQEFYSKINGNNKTTT